MDRNFRTVRPRFSIQFSISSPVIVRNRRIEPKFGLLNLSIDFAVAVQNLVTSIQAVDSPVHLYNPQLRADLVARLPSSLRLQWGEKVAQIGPNRGTVADLSTWLSAKAEALSYVAIDSMPSSEPTKTAFRPPTGEALLFFFFYLLLNQTPVAKEQIMEFSGGEGACAQPT